MPQRRSLRGHEEESAESHQRSAVEQDLKVAERAIEHRVEIEKEIEVEEQRAAELKRKVQTVKKSVEEQQHKAYDVLKWM